MSDDALLAAARAGDAASFDALVAPLRRELVAFCYRLTGSLSDSDDLVQESLLRAWRGIGGFEGRASLRSWLYRIASNVCMSELERRPRRAVPSDLGGAADPSQPPPAPDLEMTWLEPSPEPLWTATRPGPEARVSARESVAIAFLAAIQTLPPLQRAALIFRDVLGWSAIETAEALDTSVAAANSALQRARDAIERRRERWGGRGMAAADPRAGELLERYLRAWESGDLDALAALLRDDATLNMPPVPAWFAGRAAIRTFLGGIARAVGPLRLLPVPAAGWLGAASYARAPGDSLYRAQAIHAIAATPDGTIAALDVFMDPRLFPRFGLPAELPAA